MAVKLATGATVTAESLEKKCYLNIEVFGAVAGGDPVENTRAINEAIEQASKVGGCVLVPEGEFKVYTIRLQSNVTLKLERGAVLRAAKTDIRHSYVTQQGEGGNYDEPEVEIYAGLQDHGHTYFANSMFYGADLENIMICGEGLIDGSQMDAETGKREYVLLGGDPPEPEYRNEKGHRGEWFGNKCIALLRCKNVVLKDFSLVIGGHFAIIAEGVTNMLLEKLLVDTTRDALDVDCCQDVTIRNCTFNSLTDDALVLKASYGAGLFMPTCNVLIEDCVVSGYDAGSVYAKVYSRDKLIATDRCGPTGRVKLGTESTCGYHTVTIRRVKFERSRGFALEAVDGADLHDILFEDCVMDNISSSPIFIRAGERGRYPVTGNSPEELLVASTDNVRVDNRNWVLPDTDKYQKYPPLRYIPSYRKCRRVSVDGHSAFEIVDEKEPAVVNPANVELRDGQYYVKATGESLYKGQEYYFANASGSPRMAKVSDIEIRNVRITNADPRYPMLLMGLADSPIENVVLENIQVTYRGGMTMEHAVEQRQLNTNWEYEQYQTASAIQSLPWLVNTFFLKNEGLLPRVSWDAEKNAWKDDPYNVPELPYVYPEPSNWGILPAYGLYARHVKGLTCKNVSMDTTVTDERHGVVLTNVSDVQMQDVQAETVENVAKMVMVTNPYTRATNHECLLNEPYFTTKVTNVSFINEEEESINIQDIQEITLTAPAPGTPRDSLYDYPTVPVPENGYTFRVATEDYPLPVTVFRPFLQVDRYIGVAQGELLQKQLILRDPIAQATGKENDGMVYNEARARDYVVSGHARQCKVTLENWQNGLSFDDKSLTLIWDTNMVEKGKYILRFSIEDECMKDTQEVQIEIF
ncbi:MAG: hypothetical protein IJZ82_01530 [Lachnospiraceae bacterium]|nr:hypothetical protein [Lachnospiraceae bacterium]